MHRNKSVSVHQFAMVPRADIPRSSFKMQSAHKTTFDAGVLVPIYIDEVLPGDSWSMRPTVFARMSTPIFPLMDNLYLDTFWFFVPNRLVWEHWEHFCGQQDKPGDSTDFVIPKCVSPSGGYAVGSLQDYLGLPTVGQVAPGETVTHSALPLRCYNRVFAEWFRDQNLVDPPVLHTGDGPDPAQDYILLRRGKRHDYFTSCLPFPQKGDPVSIPIGTTAPVLRTPNASAWVSYIGGTNTAGQTGAMSIDGGSKPASGGGPLSFDPTGGLYADLSQATASTINQLRQAFQIQRLLERDARGGTRYVEQVRSHFGVMLEDYRAQRPVYLGGGSAAINISPIAQTSGTPGQGGYTNTPMATLAAVGSALNRGNGFHQSFTEHGHVIGLAMVRADLTYQQGLRRMWSRSTRFDFYYPVFANLGEQAVLSKEIYCDGTTADDDVFGFQERWAEYRYHPSRVSSLMRSTASGTLDAWHAAQRFLTRPTLSADFIEEKPPIDRLVAVGAQANGQQFIADMFFDCKVARPMPLYSVPGLIDHL